MYIFGQLVYILQDLINGNDVIKPYIDRISIEHDIFPINDIKWITIKVLLKNDNYKKWTFSKEQVSECNDVKLLVKMIEMGIQEFIGEWR